MLSGLTTELTWRALQDRGTCMLTWHLHRPITFQTREIKRSGLRGGLVVCVLALFAGHPAAGCLNSSPGSVLPKPSRQIRFIPSKDQRATAKNPSLPPDSKFSLND